MFAENLGPRLVPATVVVALQGLTGSLELDAPAILIIDVRVVIPARERPADGVVIRRCLRAIRFYRHVPAAAGTAFSAGQNGLLQD